MRRLLLLLLLLWPAAAGAQDVEANFKKAQELFDRLVYLEQRFDTALANLYANDARIVVIEIRGDNRYKTEMSGADMKRLIDSYFEAASIVGEWYHYSNVTLTPEGNQVRILATRTAQKSGGAFPYMLLVGPGSGGNWLIREEQSIVQPQ